MFPPFTGFTPLPVAPLPTPAQELRRLLGRFDLRYRALLGSRARRKQSGETAYREGKLKLVRHQPAPTVATPVIVVPSIISRSHTHDLLPEHSFVRSLAGAGLNVFLLDWGEPSPDDRHVTLEEYVTGKLTRAIGAARRLTGQPQAALVGYGMGGTFAAMLAALQPQQFRALVQIAAPINFHDDGVLSQWTQREWFNIDLVVDAVGTMPQALMQASFRMLTPAVQLGQQVMIAEQSNDMEALGDLLALQIWLDNTAPFLGEAYRTYIKECYQENQLVQGRLVLGGRRIDLTQITCPLLNVTATNDVICPPGSAAILNYLVSSDDKHLLELPTGHVGLLLGDIAEQQLWPHVAEWMLARLSE